MFKKIFGDLKDGILDCRFWYFSVSDIDFFLKCNDIYIIKFVDIFFFVIIFKLYFLIWGWFVEVFVNVVFVDILIL